MIYNIQRFSTHDGEGIRTMIFYKGCPLRCEWCCNPESQSFEPDVMFDSRLCKNFGDCLKAGTGGITRDSRGILIDRSLIRDPEKLRNICISKALTVIGEKKSTEDLLKEIEKDIPFYHRSKGGVTMAGGEPLSVGNELVTLLRELKKRGIDVAVETSLYVPRENVERTLGMVSTYLADLKHTNKELFRKHTGGDLNLVLENLKMLTGKKENIIIRIPVIPGFNHTNAEMEEIVNHAATLKNIREIHFIPYHTLGKEKYRMLGLDYIFGQIRRVAPDELSDYTQYAREKGFKAVIGG